MKRDRYERRREGSGREIKVKRERERERERERGGMSMVRGNERGEGR